MEYWWRKKRVKKADLKKLPNGWLRIQMEKARIMSDWRYWAELKNKSQSDECRDAVKEIDIILKDMESCMEEHGIGFVRAE